MLYGVDDVIDLENEQDETFGRLLRERRSSVALPSDFADRLVGAVVCRQVVRRYRRRLAVICATFGVSLLAACVATRLTYRFTPSAERDHRRQFVGTDVSLPQTSDFTWEAWFRTDKGDLLENRILGQTDWASEGRIFVEVRNIEHQTGGVPRLAAFYRHNGKNARIIGKTELTGAWHHFALVRQGVRLRLFLNGKLEAETTEWTHGLIDGVPFIIAPAFDGYLAEVRVWNVAKSVSEITDLSLRTLTGSEPGLVGYWPLSEMRPVNKATGCEAMVFDGGHPFAIPSRE